MLRQESLSTKVAALAHDPSLFSSSGRKVSRIGPVKEQVRIHNSTTRADDKHCFILPAEAGGALQLGVCPEGLGLRVTPDLPASWWRLSAFNTLLLCFYQLFVFLAQMS